MKSKSLIFSIFLVFIVVLGLSVVSAADADDAVLTDGEPMDGLPNEETGTVSGGVDVVTANPGPKSTNANDTSHSGELTYELPSNAKDIKSATVYVNVYSANARNESGLNANTSIVTANGEQLLGSEELWTAGGSTDGKIYTVNDHVYKCYSDYQIKYDVTPILAGLNGTSLTLKVTTFKLTNGTDGSGNATYYKFDGRIKLIALVLAYDDGDDDKINYWINAGQAWTKGNTTNLTTTFNTGSLTDLSDATLQSVVLSSADANYTINGNEITPSNHDDALWMYKYNSWNVTDALSNDDKLTFLLKPKTATGSIKNVLAVLTATEKSAKQDAIVDGEPMTGLVNEVSGTVSGGVDVVTANPGPKSTNANDTSHSGELTYEIPSNAKDIKSAIVYVNVYSANARNESGLNANTTILTANGEQLLGSEELWTAGGSSDGKIYIVNDHVYKCYSDYQIKYDVTDLLKGLNGTSLTLNVTTFKLANGTDGSGNATYYKFDGRIKLIALVLAYDDGDDDKINYWINAGQAWTKGNTTNLTTTFNTGSLTDLSDATLQSVVLSSADANYTINGNEITPSNHDDALWMYKYNSWNVTDALSNADKLTFLLKPKTATGSIKNVLAVLTATEISTKQETNGTNGTNGTSGNSTAPATSNTTTTPKADTTATTTKKVATKIVAKNKAFKAKKKSKKYTITLKAGKKVLKKFKVTLKIKGKTYKATTNSKGKATFNLKKLTKKGKYTAVIKFAGKGNYKASTKKVKITIK